MSRSSDIALSRNPANGRYNFQWSAADVSFDDSREHEVVSRLVEWRNAWWADQFGTHGSKIFQIKHLNASTKSLAEQSAREALSGMVKAKDIEVKRVDIITKPGVLGFQVVVSYDVPKSGLPTQTVRMYA